MTTSEQALAEKEKRSAALSSVVAAVFLTLLKIAVGLITGSLGILAEALHSALDLVAALVTFFAVRLSDRPPDAQHRYGHGKIENLSALIETLPPILQSLSDELQSVSGRPLRELLQSPETKTVLLRRIKDFAKELGASTKDDVEREVALAIYFAAIANALVYQNVKISQYSYTELEQSFETLSGHDWIPPNLSKLLQKAQKYCSKKK